MLRSVRGGAAIRSPATGAQNGRRHMTMVPVAGRSERDRVYLDRKVVAERTGRGPQDRRSPRGSMPRDSSARGLVVEVVVDSKQPVITPHASWSVASKLVSGIAAN